MLEKNMLEGRKPGFDWVKICKYFRSAQIQVFTFLPASTSNIQYLNQFHLMLGSVVQSVCSENTHIAQSMMSVMLKLAGHQMYINDTSILQFSQKSIQKLSKLKNEGNCYGWLTPHGNLRCSVNSKANINALRELKIDLLNLASVFKFDRNIVDIVMSLFKKLFKEQNISSILYNPVFCKLFIEICDEKQYNTIDGIFDDFITDEIKQLFCTQKEEWQKICRTNTTLRFKCPFNPSSKIYYPDFKKQCTKCAQFRSFTLMEGGKCGQCRYYENEASCDENLSQSASSGFVFNQNMDVTFVSNFRECVDCHGIYAVSKDVKCVPECHYCRNGTKPPLLKCAKCTNFFVVPDGAQSPFTCPPCQYLPHIHQSQNITTNLYALTKLNPILPFYYIKNQNLQTQNLIKHMLALLQLYLNHQKQKYSNSLYNNSSSEFQLLFNGKQILQQEEVVTQVSKIIDDYYSLETCHLCCDEFQRNELKRTCGKCNNLTCATCLKNWYGETKPGKLVLLSKLSCPFCRQIPKRKTVKQFNPEALKIINQFHQQNKIQKQPGSSNNVQDVGNSQFRDDMYYGWCQCCNRAKEAMEKTCAGDKVPVLSGFNCEECQLNEEINLSNVKRCPGCKAACIKVTGCVHIECTICYTHWCYLCEQTFDDVYEHMDNDHDEAEAYPDDNDEYDEDED
eukprot:TRINITY_DN785_c0_g1_i10.p1 TRINITY_DN785_c0_g1~~TRINITY_DN785_c0_g1_i10.p1  ORF type:complete len:678 (+),score=70.85 TRINITY_DN785_c0_g1_i10:652-2685(+)